MMVPFLDDIRLGGGQISPADAKRQERTARAVLQQFEQQPGVILADEVGMGKTFVALAVAVSVALMRANKAPVVVMVPPNLREKWPNDLSRFCDFCLSQERRAQVRWNKPAASQAVEFLKFLDDPEDRRHSIVFITHGAINRGLDDSWVMLALIRQSLLYRRNADDLRQACARFVGELLQLKWVENHDPDIWEKLLNRPPKEWLKTLPGSLKDDRTDVNRRITDDPVPDAVIQVLNSLDTDEIYEALAAMPKRQSSDPVRHKERIAEARRRIKIKLKSVWEECLNSLRLRLPLLILDEAHHVKNEQTRLARLFRSNDSQADADECTHGRLAGVFERMLFLTATPFQLGHNELCAILDRFDGIAWDSNQPPTIGREGYRQQCKDLRTSLDKAQEAAVNLDHAWGQMQHRDLRCADQTFNDVEVWWSSALQTCDLTATATLVVERFRSAKDSFREAQYALKPNVIRHLKSRWLDDKNTITRRRRLAGKAIELNAPETTLDGIDVAGESLLPFLLAARATALMPANRPVFAEGLASSYEAFLHTRQQRSESATEPFCDSDDDEASVTINKAVQWYLDQLADVLPRQGTPTAEHPKVEATVRRVLDLWQRGEKVVVFCHFIKTGRVLRQRVSQVIEQAICTLAHERLGFAPDEAMERLELLGRRLDRDSPLQRGCHRETGILLEEFEGLRGMHDDLMTMVRRNVRTPSFLVRFYPKTTTNDEGAIRQAFDTRDASGLTFRGIVREFLHFLQDRCSQQERNDYMMAVNRIQTGTHHGVEAGYEHNDDDLPESPSERLLPNVRLLNGQTRTETRQRLMRAFNTPFYPDILVASNVLAEGVDLHLSCRHMIHHDLCWNPSTLEQRTGRVDRLGAKAEQAQKPIDVYLPYIAATQDEKMYRVVMDRERWFNIVMGEDYRIDAQTTEKLATRLPFPIQAANELTFQLEVSPNLHLPQSAKENGDFGGGVVVE